MWELLELWDGMFFRKFYTPILRSANLHETGRPVKYKVFNMSLVNVEEW